MGNSSGKIDIQGLRSESKSRATVDDQKIASSREQEAQLANGDANAVNDIPSIDDVPDEPTRTEGKTGETEASPKVESNHTSGANGTAPEEKEATKPESAKVKKQGSWFKRHFSSLRDSSKKRHAKREAERSASVEDTAPVSPEGEAKTTEAEEENDDISMMATTLVENAIAEALASEEEEEAATPSTHEKSSLPQPRVETEHIEAEIDEGRQPLSATAAPQESSAQETVEGQSTPREEESEFPPSPPVPVTTESVPEEIKEVTESAESPVETEQETMAPQSETPITEEPYTHEEEAPEPESKSSPQEDEKPNESGENELDTMEIPIVDTNNTNSAETPLPSTYVDMDILTEDKPTDVEQVNINNDEELPSSADLDQDVAAQPTDEEVGPVVVDEVTVNGTVDYVTSHEDTDQPLSGKRNTEEATVNGGDVHDVQVNGD